MRINNLLAVTGFALLSISSAEASQVFVDLAVYRPSTGQFFIRSSLNGSVTAIKFGASGDQGLFCRWTSNPANGGDNLMLFRNGFWFVNSKGDGAQVNASFSYGAPTDQPLCGSYGSLNGGSVGLFRNGLWFLNGSTTPTFAFGSGGDVAVHINAKGYGSGNRQNMVYGVYRAGTWFIDEFGSGFVTRTISFGGLSQDIPLLIPGWDGDETYSLAIYRDGTWYIQPIPSNPSTVTVQFGAIGDIPLVRGAH